jgi:hypothetical protein
MDISVFTTIVLGSFFVLPSFEYFQVAYSHWHMLYKPLLLSDVLMAESHSEDTATWYFTCLLT